MTDQNAAPVVTHTGATDALPTTGARAWTAEGARVALTTCAICGAALLLDPADTIDVVDLHRRWHHDTDTA